MHRLNKPCLMQSIRQPKRYIGRTVAAMSISHVLFSVSSTGLLGRLVSGRSADRLPTQMGTPPGMSYFVFLVGSLAGVWGRVYRLLIGALGCQVAWKDTRKRLRSAKSNSIEKRFDFHQVESASLIWPLLQFRPRSPGLVTKPQGNLR